MKWGLRWGLPWGWAGDTTTQSVKVRLIGGVYKPCNTCRWFTVCVVPKGKAHPTVKMPFSRNIYNCEDYSPRGVLYNPRLEE
jgi:hypothetical protein